MIDKEMLLKKRIELNHLDDYKNVKHIFLELIAII